MDSCAGIGGDGESEFEGFGQGVGAVGDRGWRFGASGHDSVGRGGVEGKGVGRWLEGWVVEG